MYMYMSNPLTQKRDPYAVTVKMLHKNGQEVSVSVYNGMCIIHVYTCIWSTCTLHVQCIYFYMYTHVYLQ